MNSTIKKQNRILLGALIVLLTAAVILIAVTGSANRNRKNETPQNEAGIVPDENSDKSPSVTEKSGTDERSASPEKDGTKSNKSDSPEKTDSSADTAGGTDGIDTENGANDDTEVSAMQSDALPVFSSPVDNFVIKGYSADIPVFSHTMNDYRVHRGVDIACSVGTPVCAAADGTVCEVYSDPMMGFTVGVSHSGGALTRYRGLSEDSASLVSIGDEVTRGQVIGASGESALIESAEEAHVHFELTVNGEPADPAEYMSLSYLSDVYEG